MITPDARRRVSVVESKTTSHLFSNSPASDNGYTPVDRQAIVGGMRTPADSFELSRATTSAGGSRLRRGSCTSVIG
eukprot:scaffold89576_cov16-Prasinocladus_malaysianus.AAC.1